MISGGRSKYSLPSAWQPPPRNPRSLQALTYLKVEDMRIKYIGPGETDLQAATILTNHPAPIDWPLYFFEVLIVSKGVEGFIGVGFTTEEVSLSRLPGWDQHSYGYHGDDGHVFLGSGRGTAYGPTFTTGDRIGCLLNRADRSISFFKNGEPLGVAIRGVPEDRLFPCVGMRSQGEEVQVTLPSPATLHSFKSANLQDIISSYVGDVRREIDEVHVPTFQVGELLDPSQHLLPILPQLVLDYLLHHRCLETASILTRDLLGPSHDQLKGSGGLLGRQAEALHRETVCGRQKVYSLVLSGKIEEAEAEIVQRWGSATLDKNPRLSFRVKIARFCEIIRGASVLCPAAAAEDKDGSSAMDVTTEDNDMTMIEKALLYGRTVLAAHTPRTAADEELLSDALSLLAYDDPASSPTGSLLGAAEAQSLAEEVNGAILAHLGLPAVSPLERVLQQAGGCIDTLKQQNHPQALSIDLKQIIS